MGLLEFGTRFLRSMISLVWISNPLMASKKNVGKCIQKASTVFELEFETTINDEPLYEYLITLTYAGKKKTAKRHFNGDSINSNRLYNVGLIVPPNVTFSVKVETTDGKLLLERKGLKSRSYKEQTSKLMERSLVDRKKQLLEKIKNKMQMFEGTINLANFSIVNGGKSTLFNEFFKLFKSKHVPFPAGEAYNSGNAFRLFEKRKPNDEYLAAYSTDIRKKKLDDVKEMERLCFWDTPGFIRHDDETQTFTLLDITSELLAKVFKIKLANKVGTIDKEGELPNSVVVNIPLEDVMVYNKPVENEKQIPVLSYFSSVYSYLFKKRLINCVYCYTKVDCLYLYERYITHNAEIISMIDEEENLSNQELKLKLLKLFYEWDLLQRNDGTNADLVFSESPIPFISNKAPTEGIKLLFEVQCYELLNKLLKKAYHRKSAQECDVTTILHA